MLAGLLSIGDGGREERAYGCEDDGGEGAGREGSTSAMACVAGERRIARPEMEEFTVEILWSGVFGLWSMVYGLWSRV